MKRLIVSLTVAGACAALVAPPMAAAAGFQANSCVASKLKEAGKDCGGLLKAWASWDSGQDDGKRDASIDKTELKFTDKWDKTNTKATDKGSDCATATASDVEVQALIDGAVASIVASVNTGLTLTPAGSSDGKCASKLLKIAGKQCSSVLNNYSKFIKSPAKDPTKTKLTAANVKALTKFQDKFDSTLTGCSSSTATTAGIEGLVDTLRDDLVEATTTGPNLSDTEFEVYTFNAHADTNQQDKIEYEGRTLEPSCLSHPTGDLNDFDDFSFFVKRGANGNENKVFIHLEGGGACWDFNSCFFAPLTDPDVQVYGECNSNICENGSAATNGDACVDDEDCLGNDNPNQLLDPLAPGFFDFSDVRNPWHDWTIVWIPTCGGDVFSGDVTDNYINYNEPGITHRVRHRGYQNAKVAERFVREHFLDPEQLVVTGLSAGSAGLLLHQYYYNLAYPAAQKTVIYDSFVLVVAQEFLDGPYQNWDGEKNFPEGIVVQAPTNEAAHIYTANLFPDTTYAHITNAFDAPLGQTQFYHVMKNLGTIAAWTNWWESACEWNGHMQDQLAATALGVTNDNYRSYVAAGTVHGMFPSDRAYDDTSGGVPTLVDWVDDLLDGGALPANVQASPSNVLVAPTDPKPSPLVCPFEQSGLDVIINCSSCTP